MKPNAPPICLPIFPDLVDGTMASDLFLMDFESVTVLHLELQ